MLSIVIPTLNEEKYISTLLGSLARQTYKDFDVVVVDGGSKDRTVPITESFENKFPVKVVVSQKKGVSYQRNLGARQRSAEKILFLDADVVLDERFLEALLKETRGVDVANSWLIPISEKRIDKMLYNLYNLFFLELGRYVWPVAVGSNIYITRKMFEKIGGFDEKIAVWEDVDIVQRAIKAGGKFAVLRKPKIYVSVRRFEMIGRINYIKDSFKVLQYIARYGTMPPEEKGYYPMGLDYNQLKSNGGYNLRYLRKITSKYGVYINKFKTLAKKLNIRELIES